MNVNPGELNKRIEFYAKSATTDGDGFYSDTETLYYSCFAKFSRTSGTEMMKAGADMSEVNARFLIRYPKTKTIIESLVLKYNGNTYEIVFVNDYEDKHEYIEIFTKLVK